MQLLVASLSLPALAANQSEGVSLPSLFGSKSAAQPDFLPAEQAFMLDSELQGQTLQLRLQVAPGYYLYRDRIRVRVDSGNVIIGEAHYDHLPQIKEDPEFGRVPVFHEDVLVTVPVQGQGRLKISWQGCAEKGLCYPPLSRMLDVSTGPTPIAPTATAAAVPVAKPVPMPVEEISIPIPSMIPTVTYDLPPADDSPTLTTASQIIAPATLPSPASTLAVASPASANASPDPFNVQQKPLVALFTLWLLGLGLAFTPCVLPMLPIVAGIVARQHARNAWQGFSLALSYAVGVASSYATLGAVIALFGSQANLALWLQHPAVLISFSLLFAVLALASFDVFHLQLPHALQERLDSLSQRGKAGSYIGTFGMGYFAALVVSPCVSAPLAGVLLSVSTVGNPVLGAVALFALGFGLSTPLLILGASEGKLMPKGGLWLNRVKQAFGILLLGVALTLLARVMDNTLMLALWAVLVAGTGFWLNVWGGKWRVLWRTLSYICLIWSAALLLGAASGHDNPWQPLAGGLAPSSAAVANTVAPTRFQTIHSSIELDALLQESERTQSPVLLDFYADWCISCKQMEREVFANHQVASALQGWTLVRADVTANDEASRRLLQRFQLFGPPAVLFFRQGQELGSARLVGEVDVAGFLDHLRALP